MMATNPNMKDRIDDAEEITGEGPRPLYRELPPPTAFPIDDLGPVLAAAAKAITAMIECPVECAANSVLAVASLASQGIANVILPVGFHGKPAPLSLFLMTVLESGERKSSADSMALKPVRDFEHELAVWEAGERRAYAVKAATYEANHKHLTNSLKKNRPALEAALHELGPAPQPPLLSVLASSSDPTMEGIFRIYQHGRPSLAVLCDDAASFLGGHSMKAEQKQSTTANLCRAWDGGKLERIRGGDGVIVLYDRRLSLHLMVQPGVAAGFLSDDRFADQGLLARFLISAPQGRAGTRIRDDAAYQALARAVARDLEAYNTAVSRLLRRPIRWKDENDRALGVELGELHLTADARAMYVAFCNALEVEMLPQASLDQVKAFANKLADHAARIAGTLALMADPHTSDIDAAMLGNAINLAKYYLAEALRLTAAGAIDPELRRAEVLRKWLLEQPGDVIGLRTIYQYGPSGIRQADKARSAMALLVDHGWAVSISGGATIDGKAHRSAWRIIRC